MDMKKITFTLICAVLTMSLLLCGCLVDDPANQTNAPTQVITDNQGQTVVAPADATVSSSLIGDDVAQLNLISNGNFYFVGSLTDANGEYTLMEMAKQNENSYMGSQMDGVSVGFMHTGADYYMVYPAGECALLLDDEVCATLELDPTEMDMDTSKLSFGELSKDQLINTSDALVDTAIATCRTYQQDNGKTVKTYVSDGRLIRLQQFSAEGALLSTLDIDILTDAVPAEKVSIPSSYKTYSGSTGMLSFMLKFASAIGMDTFSE